MKNNKLIAEFMQKGSEGFGLYDYNGKHYKLYELKFHTSWDWLVPALKKAQQEIPVNKAGLWRMITHPINYNIKDVYNQLVEFISENGRELSYDEIIADLDEFDNQND